MNTLPNLIISGAARAGTSHLLKVLYNHPEIWMNRKWPRECSLRARRSLHSSSAEIHFFSTDLYRYGIDFYKKFFDGIYYHKDEEQLNPRDIVYGEADGEYIKTYKYIGEKSPSYSSAYRPETNGSAPLDLMKKHLGEDTKIILCVREPAQRCHSQWAHLQEFNYGPVWEHYVGKEFDDAIKPHKPHKWLKQNPHENLILMGSDYSYMYSELLKRFKPENIFIQVNEEMKLSPMKEIKRLFDWLELDEPKYNRSHNVINNRASSEGAWGELKLGSYVNFSNYSTQGYLSEEEGEKVKEHFRDMKDNFYNQIGREIKVWEI